MVLTGWPFHRAASKNMNMQVKDTLTSAFAIISINSLTA